MASTLAQTKIARRLMLDLPGTVARTIYDAENDVWVLDVLDARLEGEINYVRSTALGNEPGTWWRMDAETAVFIFLGLEEIPNVS